MAIYRFELTPLESYFFGGEKTFGDKENYFVRSLIFPQQTTILGALRHLLLIHSGLIKKDTKFVNNDETIALIGEKGFRVNNERNNYGIIINISPVFVFGRDGDYLQAPLEYGFDLKYDEYQGIDKELIFPLIFRVKKGMSNSGFGQREFIPCINDIGPKSILPRLLIEKKTGIKRKFDEVFFESEEVGINLSNKDDNDDKGFHKQIVYRMAKGYGFAFYADIDKDELPFKTKDIFHKIGTNQTLFKVSIIKEGTYQAIQGVFEGGIEKYLDYPNSLSSKIILLSDSYIEREIFEKEILFSLSESNPLRYMETDTKKSEGAYYNSSSGIYLKKSDIKYDLISRGSVLFVDSSKKTKIIKKIKEGYGLCFNQIGYNYVI